ncbi:hypothetical protein POM88_007889 [Heracleum sosnowskyi]|uniref:F-box protein n=1 Tax=Heracleum sosnowskyi TaxID=360622 RepID=A0AAD8N6V5_9APIA|nr:hypothetical protein POM88_007889 [Heracleum sosnowskyi]
MDRHGNNFEDFANEDLFPRLTDDLLILILLMVSGDLKFLCQCMLISKRFALLIPLISSGTLSIPLTEYRSQFEFFKGKVTYVDKALRSFSNIRSVHLEFVEEECRESILQWKAVFRSNTYTCACLAYNSITKLSSAGASAIAAGSQTIKNTVIGTIFRLIVDPDVWCSLLGGQPMVESVVITDSKRQGKVYFLHDTRTCTNPLDFCNSRFEGGRTSFKFIEVPELRLPKSGFLMKGVYLAINKVREHSAEDDKYDDLLNCNFGPEENVFGEALNLILGTPEDRFVVRGRYAHGFHVSHISICEIFLAQAIYAFITLRNFHKIPSLHLKFIEEECREFNSSGRP